MKVFTIFLMLLPMFLFGQGWEATIGSLVDDYARSIQQTDDGGYIIVGSKLSVGGEPWYATLIKTNWRGQVVWTKYYDGEDYCVGEYVEKTSDGGYIITGYSSKEKLDNKPDIFLLKTNKEGNKVWIKKFGGDYIDAGRCVKQTSDGGYILTGVSDTYGNGYLDICIIKTDNYGNIVWDKTIGVENYNDEAYSIELSDDGGYILTGWMTTQEGGLDLCLIKIDDNGNLIWSKTYGNEYYDCGYTVSKTNDGGYIIVGKIGVDFSNDNVYLLKTNGSGDIVWTKSYGGENDDVGNFVQQTSDGGFIIAGYSKSYGSGVNDVFMIKTNNIGDTIWTKTYGGYGDDRARCVRQTNDGGYIISGITDSFGSGGVDIYLIKTDENGISPVDEVYETEKNVKIIKLIDLSGKEINKPKLNQIYIEVYDNGTYKKKILLN